MQPIVEITEQADYESFRAFCYFTAIRRPMAWINWICLYGVIPAIAAIMVVLDVRKASLSPFTPVYLALFVILLVRQMTALRSAFKKRSHGFVSSNAAFFEDYFAYVTTGQNSTSSGSVSYGDVAKAYETATAFYLEHSNRGWSFFPKKFFAPGQVEALRELFARKFGERLKTKL